MTTRSRVASLTRGLSLNTRDTVATEILLARATSRIVAMTAFRSEPARRPARCCYRIRMPLLRTSVPPVFRRYQ